MGSYRANRKIVVVFSKNLLVGNSGHPKGMTNLTIVKTDMTNDFSVIELLNTPVVQDAIGAWAIIFLQISG